MKHAVRPAFWRFYRALPKEIQALADKNYTLLRANPRHPSLRFKKVRETKDGDLWSARVGRDHRALAVEVDGTFVWFWIGPHDEYDAMLS